MRIRVVLTLSFLHFDAVRSLSTTPQKTEIHIVPSQVEFRDVCQQYPATLARRLFSSVPRRDYALHNVSFKLKSELVLLTGASSSGKSTILRLLWGKEQPSHGSIHVTSCVRRDDDVVSSEATGSSVLPAAQPVYLDQRPSFDNRQTIHQILREQLINLTPSIATQLIQAFCALFALNASDEQWMKQRTSSLAPSECYRLDLVLACLKSTLGDQSSDVATQVRPIMLPAPILLLDEWMDKETSTIVQTVQKGLTQAAKQGAVIVSVTHKPERWKTSGCSCMTLCRGEILSFRQGP